MEHQEDRPSAQHHKDRPTDETEATNSGNVNPGVVNYKQGTPSWGQIYQSRSEKCLEELETPVKNRGQSKVVPGEMPVKPVHAFAKKSYQIQSEFNNSVFKEDEGCLGGRYK